MKVELNEIRLESATFEDSFSSRFGPIRLRLTNPIDDQPGDIEFRTDSGEFSVLRRFAERSFRSGDMTYPALVYVLTMDAPVVLLMGLYQLALFVDESCSCRIDQLFRSDIDDAGFFRKPDLLVADEYILLRYEKGILCFLPSGELIWHVECCLDDEIVNVDENRVWLSNEHVAAGQKWAISLEDGNPD